MTENKSFTPDYLQFIKGIPFPSLAQELFDYVNSTEYKQLEKKDQLKIYLDTYLNFHTIEKQ